MLGQVPVQAFVVVGQGRLDQRLQRGDLATQGAVTGERLLARAVMFDNLATVGVALLDQPFTTLLELLGAGLVLGQLTLHFFALCAEAGQVRQFIELLTALGTVGGDALEPSFQLTQAVLGAFGLVAVAAPAFVEGLPFGVGLLHRGLGLFQRRFQLGQLLCQFFLLGAQGLQAILEGQQPLAVILAEAIELVELAAGTLEIPRQLLIAGAGVFELLLEAGDGSGGLVKACLALVELRGQAIVLGAGLFQPGLALAHAEHLALHRGLELAHPGVLLGLGGTQGASAQQRKLPLDPVLFFFQRLIASGRLGLTLEPLELLVQLLTDIVEPVQVLLGATHAIFGLATALLVLGDTGGLFQGGAQLFGARLDQPRDHALADDGVGARPQAGAQEQVGDVASATLLAVEEVAGLGVPGDLTLDRDLGVLGVDPAHGAVTVVEGQLDGGHAHRLAPGGAVEDDVGHRLATQGLGRGFAHDPAYGVDDVRLAAAVGTDDGGHVAVKGHRDRIDEGLEPGQPDRRQTHGLFNHSIDDKRDRIHVRAAYCNPLAFTHEIAGLRLGLAAGRYPRQQTHLIDLREACHGRHGIAGVKGQAGRQVGQGQALDGQRRQLAFAVPCHHEHRGLRRQTPDQFVGQRQADQDIALARRRGQALLGLGDALAHGLGQRRVVCRRQTAPPEAQGALVVVLLEGLDPQKPHGRGQIRRLATGLPGQRQNAIVEPPFVDEVLHLGQLADPPG